MTAYACVDLSLGDRHYRAHLKSVNHRFFELRLRLPRDWLPLEIDIRSWLREALRRGSVDLWIEEADKEAKREPALRNFWKRLKEAVTSSRAEFGGIFFPTPLRILVLSHFPELWLHGPTEPTLQPEAQQVQAALEHLCARLDEARLLEGARTAQSVREERERILALWQSLQVELPRLRQEWQQNLSQRLGRLSEELDKVQIPEDARLQQELLLLAEKRDVAEEMQRIDSHLQALEDLLGQDGSSVGKRLDFLAQELNREWTTLNNKVQSAPLSRDIGEAKLSVEGLREQSLNLL